MGAGDYDFFGGADRFRVLSVEPGQVGRLSNLYFLREARFFRLNGAIQRGGSMGDRTIFINPEYKTN